MEEKNDSYALYGLLGLKISGLFLLRNIENPVDYFFLELKMACILELLLRNSENSKVILNNLGTLRISSPQYQENINITHALPKEA